MTTVAEAARLWQLNGFSVIPILANATKRPATRWREYIAQAPSLDQVNEWWGNGHPFGIAVICGAVSDNLEMTEIEARAHTGDTIIEIRNRLDEAGHLSLWDFLTGEEGYTELSPTGGLHILYRVADHPVPGNTKIASAEDRLVLAETRGEGGYVIVAPSPGACHPSGDSWSLHSGTYGRVPVISWEERCALHDAIGLALNPTIQAYPARSSPDSPIPAVTPPIRPLPDDPTRYASSSEALALPASSGPPARPGSSAGVSPGNDFSTKTDWSHHDLLGGLNWSLTRTQGQYREWCRAGKNPRDGMSATTGKDPNVDRLWVFSTSTLFPAEESISKFHAYALIHHGGDDAAAARALKRRGFGTALPVADLDTIPFDTEQKTYARSDMGNAEMVWDRLGHKYRYVVETKDFYVFDGRVWRQDLESSLVWEFAQLGKEMARSDDKVLAAWGVKCGNTDKANGMKAALKSIPGCSVSLAEFDTKRGLANVNNGVLELRTGELKPHDPSLLLTQMFSATYDPAATCPNFESFIEQAVPDADMRAYIQRALGYTLLGDSDQRAMFLIYGPSGTGKSTLMETMRDVFGTYGQTAPAGTFRAKREGDGPTADLHTLRGRRFVSTSETAESAAFDEDLLKRLTGRDMIQSRSLYEKHVEWSPQIVLWMATNNPPRLNSDDDAVWRRLKMIPFLTQFLGEGERFDVARRELMPERNGILNWLLAGLAEYLRYGLQEPDEVADSVKEQRLASDSVARFLEDRLSDGALQRGEDGQIRADHMYALYQDWTRQVREHPVGSRRFTNRLLSNFPWLELTKISSQRVFTGVSRANLLALPGSWIHSDRS